MTLVAEVPEGRCPQCLTERMVDMEDELVCASCGTVQEKEDGGTVTKSEHWVTAAQPRRSAMDYTHRSLGSFMGEATLDHAERKKVDVSRLASGGSSIFYLKTVSDYGGRDSVPGEYACLQLIDRVREKLRLPDSVVGEAVLVAKHILSIKDDEGRRGYTISTVSAFAIISACRVCGVASLGSKEVIEAHEAMGHRVIKKALLRMGFDSPQKRMQAEDYLQMVLAHLPSTPIAGYQYSLHKMAMTMLSMLDSSVRGGHNPRTLAATLFYASEALMAEREDRGRYYTQKDFSSCVGVAEYTVRETFCEICRPRWEEIKFKCSS